MQSFRNNRLLEPVDVSVANLIGALGCLQGRQELYRHQVPQRPESLYQEPSQSIASAVEALHPGDTFTIADLERAAPGVSQATIRRVLESTRPGMGQVPGEGTLGAVAEGINAIMSALNTLMRCLDERITRLKRTSVQMMGR